MLIRKRSRLNLFAIKEIPSSAINQYIMPFFFKTEYLAMILENMNLIIISYQNNLIPIIISEPPPLALTG